jgi:trans-aconitate methyltransferase
MRLLHGGGFQARYQEIARLIPSGVTMIDLCCGDAYLYRKYLAGRVDYLGIDNNSIFINWLKRRGINCRRLDVMRDDIGQADYLVLQASLHQFIPNHRELLIKALRAAKKRVIISEPKYNLADHPNFLIRTAAQILTSRHRFSRDAIVDLYLELGITKIIELDREIIGIAEKN